MILAMRRRSGVSAVSKFKRLSDYTWNKDWACYLDSDGVGHGSDLVSVMMTIIGFCGCGQPDSVLEMMRDGMELMSDEWRETHEEARKDHRVYFAELQKRQLEIFGNWAMADFFWHWLDANDLSEHGGSVPGWLTKSGHDLLEDIRAALKPYEQQPTERA